MTWLPIVARELRVASRRPGTYRVRWGAGLGLILVAAWFFLRNQHLPAEHIAMGLFLILTGGAVLCCLLSGVWFTADCLSEEKREGTLGLLFLTDLKGYDVVLGKLAATSLGALYAVLAAVPILALPLLLGGVTGGEFARMALVAINTLFFSLTLGLCVSALSRSQRSAMTRTLLLVLLFAAVLPACGACLTLSGATPKTGRSWLMASPFYTQYHALDQQFSASPGDFWWSVAVIHGLGWTCLLLASGIVPHTWQDRPAGARALRWRERWRTWTYGNQTDRALFRERLMDRSACFWLTARARWKPASVWAVLGVVACGWGWGLAKWHRHWLDESTLILTGLLLNYLLKVWFALEAGRQLSDDRKAGALELLLSTPLTVKEILHGHLLALRRQFQWPVTVVLLVCFLFMILGALDANLRPDTEHPALWILLWAAGMVILVADLAGLYWLGMWRGLTAKGPIHAAGVNMACILLLPWGIALIAIVPPSLGGLGGVETRNEKYVLGLWVGLCLAVDLGFGLWARRKLHAEFRRAAARGYEPRPKFWKR
ncbi:MAG TPA: ABC transporter permease subunit [Candidatus Paceibacterota bacterium]|nr:ABC transporter permease subunit [Verrucomicrobiota bacterium]HSA12901.1 ABC transporter permease subunit [Candidatus Paceibacterota bacterium]